MKKIFLTFTLLFFSVYIIRGANVSFGIFGTIGKTIVDEENVEPINAYSTFGFNNNFKSIFVQGFLNFNKISIGIEYGKAAFYFTEYNYVSYKNGGYSIINTVEKHNPKKVLLLFKYSLIDSMPIEIGVGYYFIDSINSYNSNVGFTASIQRKVKLNEFLEIPFILRSTFLTSKGNPISISLGVGIAIKQKLK